MPPNIPRRSNSSLRGRQPYDAAKPDSEAFSDAVQQVKSTGSVGAAARKLALYAKMTGGTPPSAKAEQVVDVEAAKAKDEGRVQAVAGDEEVQKDEGGDGDVVMDPATASQSRPAATRASSATKPKAPSAFDDPEEQEYAARNAYIAAQAKRNATINGHGGNGQIAEEDECAVDDEDMEDDEDHDEREGERVDEAPMVHLQEIVEGLWVGDLVAAMDTDGLKARGITNILSLLRPKIQFSSEFAVFPLEIDDSPDTDILTHLPSCVAWIGEALRRRERARERLRRSSSQSIRRRTSTSSNKSASRSSTSPLAENGDGGSHNHGHLRENSPPEERDVSIRHLPQTTAGAVLVHCQAGMSRSATAAAAYLMTALSISPEEAVSIIRSKRPVVDPSETFWHQLGLFHSADGRVSLRDRETRQFYMERTTTKFMNRGGQPDISHMAKYPATPTASAPPTPVGSHGKRKIRCKMCRRHLAVREHMMDHILEQSPASRPRTPSVGAMAGSMTPILPQDGFANINGSGQRERRPSVVSDIINPLTGLPGARSRHASMSSDRPALGDFAMPSSTASQPGSSTTASSQHSVPTPRSRSIDVTASGFGMTAMDATRSQSSEGFGDGEGSVVRADSPASMGRSSSMDQRPAADNSASASIGHGSVRRKSSLSQMTNASNSNSNGGGRQLRSAEQIYAHLPPQLAALRMAQNGGVVSSAYSADSSPIDAGSPPSSPERDSHATFPSSAQNGKPFPQAQYPPNHPLAQLQNSQSAHAPHVPHKHEGARGAARRMSMLALTPTEGTSPGAERHGAFAGALGNGGGGAGGSGTNSPRERRGSAVFGFGGEIATGGPPILVNPKCSGYFVEPLTWMEPVLASGQISGKLVCPNEKCGAKIGNYDWAGVQCGCKEWVTPGFCISRSKVDEVW